ncbi:hypothetical protein [Staphylococcus epidermidis]|uniref:hypothetical protein n=1 Tax=Staphylococcus epidermidis TaxID=1282 RepID=UPI00119F9037|nr:hypothetical protein [Staphylococcus epidermidis]
MIRIKKWFLFILIAIMLLVFYIIVAKLKGIEYKDKITLCISFTGLFATFLGAYLGAKISSDNARKMQKEQLEIQNLEKNIGNNYEYLVEFEKLIRDFSTYNFKGFGISLIYFLFVKNKFEFYDNLVYMNRQLIAYNSFKSNIVNKNLYGTNISLLVNRETRKFSTNFELLYSLFMDCNNYALTLIKRNYDDIKFENITDFFFLYYNGDRCIFRMEFNNGKSKDIDIMSIDKKGFKIYYYIFKFYSIQRKMYKENKKLKYRTPYQLLNYINSLYQ